jgi:signal transduction histidine kinase
MQASLSAYVDNIGLINTQMVQRNRELTVANKKALEADRKKTAFLQDMMHQIRTPLNIICGFAQVLNDSFHELPPDESRNITQVMQDNARKMTHITRLLLGFASPTSHIVLKKETFSCNEVCREAVDHCRLANPSTVQLRFETILPDDFTIHTDKQRVQLILEELLDNANKFTQQGTITVSCGQKDQQTVTIRVSDTGIGIAKTDRKNIFTQFVKIDLFTEGVGLGLPLSKRAAQRIGGDLVLDEAYDQGAAFVLTIPINI